jgi:hypothetical protein
LEISDFFPREGDITNLAAPNGGDNKHCGIRDSERAVSKDRVTAYQSQRLGAIRRSSRAGMGLLFHRIDLNGDLIGSEENNPV